MSIHESGQGTDALWSDWFTEKDFMHIGQRSKALPIHASRKKRRSMTEKKKQ